MDSTYILVFSEAAGSQIIKKPNIVCVQYLERKNRKEVHLNINSD